MSKNLLERCEHFISELGVSKSKFCRNVQISESSYYAWRTGHLTLSEETLKRIDEYLKNYNF